MTATVKKLLPLGEKRSRRWGCGREAAVRNVIPVTIADQAGLGVVVGFRFVGARAVGRIAVRSETRGSDSRLVQIGPSAWRSAQLRIGRIDRTHS
jgi:hypothetical protein